ncbi:ABC-three component system protein [Nocardioides limicola]|uniref:ABC-three component system protein n=1 Tax=Nocardioides limicola TaxID=2803368 RepID=UPI00193B944F|nr:ABC-three component system protein [Nocardioides sp. DJM-14]
MDFYERLSMRPLLWSKLHSLTGDAFQGFFHDLMTCSDPAFVDVRTHGNLGDLASDGLSLHERRLYACYAPETPDASKTVSKFNGDLAGALAKRSGQFDSFVFVHNDTRGTHPEVSAALAGAHDAHGSVRFEVMGFRHLRDVMGRLSRDQVETLLGTQLPLQHTVTVGLAEMEELLAELSGAGVASDEVVPVEAVSIDKLRFSDLTPDSQAELRDAMRHSPMIDDYYARRIDVTERDEVAARFNLEYRDAVADSLEPEDTLLRLREFLAGSRIQSGPLYRAQTAVLAYFFQRCDIFENPPAGWAPPTEVAS